MREGAHIIKFDLDAEVQGVTVEERFRGQFYNLETQQTNRMPTLPAGSFAAPPTRATPSSVSTKARIILKGRTRCAWTGNSTTGLLASAGYLYSQLNADSTFNLETTTLPGFINAGDQRWNVPKSR